MRVTTPKTAVEEVTNFARDKYRRNPALYHNDFKICLYGVYMEVVMGFGEELRKEAERERCGLNDQV